MKNEADIEWLYQSSINHIMVQEWALPLLKQIDQPINDLSIYNTARKEIDEIIIAQDIASIKGIDNIKTLTVGYNCMMSNVTFLKAFPSLELLILHGQNLRSLDGIQWFNNGGKIIIELTIKQKCIIDQISETNMTALEICWTNHNDFIVISKCRELVSLIIKKNFIYSF